MKNQMLRSNMNKVVLESNCMYKGIVKADAKTRAIMRPLSKLSSRASGCFVFPPPEAKRCIHSISFSHLFDLSALHLAASLGTLAAIRTALAALLGNETAAEDGNASLKAPLLPAAASSRGWRLLIVLLLGRRLLVLHGRGLLLVAVALRAAVRVASQYVAAIARVRGPRTYYTCWGCWG